MCAGRRHPLHCALTLFGTHAIFALQYEELEKRKAEAEEKVTYIFSRKKAITQGERGRFLCAFMACLPAVSAGGWEGEVVCIVTRKQAII